MHDILALAVDCRDWHSNVKYAAQLATLMHGSLTGVYAAPTLAPMPDIASPVLAAEIIEIYREQARQAERARPHFVSWAKSLGVERVDWRVVEGRVLSVLEYAANWYDVLVLQHGEGVEWTTAGELGEILLRVGLPCIVVPTRVNAARLDTIAIAWNGSGESARAVHAALPLLQRASRLYVLADARRETSAAHERLAVFDIEKYLTRHDLDATYIPISADSDEAGDVLLCAATDAQADLLVMGAYGRTRFSEWLLGGATRHALKHSTIPLFMRH